MDGSQLRSELERNHVESYGWAMCCCAREPAHAEEVLQAVYLKVLEGKAVYDGRALFKTWLFAVVRRTAAEERRRKLLRQLRLLRYRPPSAREQPLDEAIYRSEMQTLFLEALARLPGRQREVLHLLFYHDLSLSEAAGVMGVSVGAARKHYDRGKRALRRQLTENPRDEARHRKTSAPGVVC